MKALIKHPLIKIPTPYIVVDSERYSFINGKELFKEKSDKARERFKTLKLPPR